jgi:hypothetical protein
LHALGEVGVIEGIAELFGHSYDLWMMAIGFPGVP